MMNRLREQVTQLLAHIEIRQPEPMPAAPQPEPAQQRMQAAMAGGDSASNSADWKNVSRNAPCPCGSGKKYKHCHGKLG
jgi:preprotein translocase subunit SecA